MNKLHVVLVLAVVSTAAAHIVVNRDPGTRNRDYAPQMVYSPAAESFAASAILRRGSVLQAAPAGTIARNASLVRYAATPSDALRAGAELTAPSLPAEDEARGATVYATFCAPCHGAGGLGNGPVARRGFPAPPSLLAPRAAGRQDGQLYHVVTYGQQNMPGYGVQIDEEDRWRVVAHVRRLQRSVK